MYGEHIDQRIQHWPGGIWWLFGGEQGVKAKKRLQEDRGRKSSKRGSQRYMPGDMGDGRSTQRNTDLCLRRFGQKCLKLSRQIVKN
jgi:hypothetical protein